MWIPRSRLLPLPSEGSQRGQEYVLHIPPLCTTGMSMIISCASSTSVISFFFLVFFPSLVTTTSACLEPASGQLMIRRQSSREGT